MDARSLAAELCTAVHAHVNGTSTSIVQDAERGMYVGAEACFDVEWFDVNDQHGLGMPARTFLVTVKQIA